MIEITGSAQRRIYELVKSKPHITIPEMVDMENVPSHRRKCRITHYNNKLRLLEKQGFVERVPDTMPIQWRLIE